MNHEEYLKHRRDKHKREPRIRMRQDARERAVKKGRKFYLKSYKDIPKIPKFCPILKIPLFVKGWVGTDNSPTLDRIDNDKDYFKSNIRVISRKANQMKSNGSFEEIKMLYFFMKKERGVKMSAIKDKAMDFLENGGYDLDYDEYTLPKLEDMDTILDTDMYVWEYKGMTEEEYYGIDENEGKTMP